MKATGIVRKVDDLGRITLPKEMRRTQQIAEGDPVEIFVHGETIVLRKYEPGCVFCGNVVDVQTHFNKSVCAKCAKEIGQKAQE